MKAFYIDVELPGLESEDKMKLRWISLNTLLLKAVMERKGAPEDEVTSKEDDTGPSKELEEAVVAAKSPEIGDKDQDKSLVEKKEPAIYLTLGERCVGLCTRACHFPVDVDHEKTTAGLKAGVLRITVTKVEEAKQVNRTVSIENNGRR